MPERSEHVSITSVETKIQAPAELRTDLGELHHDASWMCRTLDWGDTAAFADRLFVQISDIFDAPVPRLPHDDCKLLWQEAKRQLTELVDSTVGRNDVINSVVKKLIEKEVA
jgi:hypothetical protein